MSSATPPVHLHLIAWNPEVMAATPPGWRALDHTANERSDWFEYTPIRRFLLAQALDEHAWYGFFSPKFTQKTGHDHASARAQVHAGIAAGADVVVFSPQPDMGAFFANVYEQGEACDPGFMVACGEWLARIGRPMNLMGLVMDSRQVAFSNYVVARPAFWREWLAVNETLYELCEHGEDALAERMRQRTSYGAGVQRKVFVMERTASLLLATEPRWKSHPVNPFRMAWSTSRLRTDPELSVMADALKRAYRDFGFPAYLEAFSTLRERFTAPVDRAAAARAAS